MTRSNRLKFKLKKRSKHNLFGKFVESNTLVLVSNLIECCESKEGYSAENQRKCTVKIYEVMVNNAVSIKDRLRTAD